MINVNNLRKPLSNKQSKNFNYEIKLLIFKKGTVNEHLLKQN